MNENEYTLGECYMCHQTTALKDGLCATCKTKQKEFPELFGKDNLLSDIFSQFNKEDK